MALFNDNKKQVDEKATSATATVPAVIDEKLAKKLAKRAARKAKKGGDWQVVKTALDALSKQYPDNADIKKAVAALKAIKPSIYGLAVSGGAVKGEKWSIFDMLEKGAISENDVFNKFKMGRREVQSFFRKALRKSEPADRIWVNFDADKCEYSIAGKGASKPETYTGAYDPNVAKVDEGDIASEI